MIWKPKAKYFKEDVSAFLLQSFSSRNKSKSGNFVFLFVRPVKRKKQFEEILRKVVIYSNVKSSVKMNDLFVI